MKHPNNVSKAKLDQFRQRKGLSKFSVEYIERPFIQNVRCLSTYKHKPTLRDSYVYSFNVDGNLLQIHLVMDANKLTILPIVKLKNESFFDADFHADDNEDNKLVCWFVNKICTEFFDLNSGIILGSVSDNQTLWEITERFKEMIRKKQSLRDFESGFYYSEIAI